MEIYAAPTQLTRFSHSYATASQPMVLYDASGQQHVVKFAEKVEYGSVGLSHEYLGGSLAGLIEASVPTTTFVQLAADTLSIDQNIVFADGTRPAPQITVGSSYVQSSGSPATPDAFLTIPVTDAAGIFVYNTWVAVGDRHWGNYVVQTTTTGYRLFSIDYVSCLSAASAAVTGIRDPDLVAVARRAPDAVEEFLRRVEAVTERSIRATIGRIPRTWLDDAQRERIAQFLLVGRASTRVAVLAALA